MPTFQIAHVREQGEDIIFILLDQSFARQTDESQAAQIAELQERANSAGLSGIVVPCWYEIHRWHFVGPPQWRALFESIPPGWVKQRLNHNLRW